MLREKSKEKIFGAWLRSRTSFLLILCGVFVAVGSIAGFISYGHYQHILANALSVNRTEARLLARIILEHEKAMIGVLQSYGSRLPLVQAARERDLPEVLKHLAQLKEANPEIDGLALTDPKGILLANYPVNPESLGKDFSYRDWYRGVSKEWKPYVSGGYRQVIGDRQIAVFSAVPLFDKDAKVFGILGSSQRSFFLGEIIRQASADPEAQVTLIDQGGNVIYGSRFSLAGEPQTYPYLREVRSAAEGKKDVLTLRGPRERGGESYLGFAPVQGIGWTVVVEREKGEILRAASGYFFQVATVALSLFLALAVFFIYLRKSFLYRKTEGLLRAEKEINESQRRYSSLLEDVSLCAVGLDARGKITFANPFLLTLTGYSSEEVLGKNWFEIFLPEETGRDVQEVFQALLQKNFPAHYENPIVTRSGEERLIHWSNTVLLDMQGKAVGTMSLGEDITEQKNAEQGLLRLNRTYKVLSQVNQAIVHIRERQRLFEETCRIAVEDGKFLMAWIGLAEDDGTVKPLASHGSAADYLAAIRVSARDVPDGRGPIGTAIREGRVFACNDIEREDYTKPWREKALQMGYRSSAAFPLKIGGDWKAALSVYSSEVNFFDAEEVLLFEELAADITYALEAMEVEEERRRAVEALRASEEAALRAAQENTVIAELGRVISSSMDIEEVYEKFAAGARRLIPFDRITISVINLENRTLTITYAAGEAIPGRETGVTFPLTGSMMEDTLRSRRGLLLQGKSPEEMERHYPRHLGFQAGFRSFLTVPLISGDQVIGAIYLSSTQSAPYEERHVVLAEGIANQIAGAVANASLFRECRQAEEWERLARRVLELLNRPEGTTDTIGDILRLIKRSTNFEAMGIRLREGDDFPYYKTNGLAEDFVKAENSLCARDEAGEIVRDAQGNPLLECMCGNILSGRFDPALPFFTAGGSFWTNRTTALPATTTESECQARIRNRCGGEGYESVGLIPLRSGREIIGLLQLNDRRRNRFTPEMIGVLEGLGNSIGIALARERSHEQIKASLKEKNVLLAEIHHRVKNNMQIISSLLRMQSRHIKDEELIKVFLDSQTRIRTMALIHEKLYRSGNFSRIDLAEYIRDLAVNLYTSYGVKRERIGLKVQGEGIFLGIKEAIPCGLIVNELISNALKHAFPGKSKGEITVALEADNGRIKIAVKDNGVGLTADLDFRRTESLGLQLVMTLVEQLEGAIDLHREGGTEFVITFASEKNERNGYLS